MLSNYHNDLYLTSFWTLKNEILRLTINQWQWACSGAVERILGEVDGKCNTDWFHILSRDNIAYSHSVQYLRDWYSKRSQYFYCTILPLGVSKVDTNVEAKSVIVTADDGVTGEQLVEKLSKWSEASGKYVKLA